MRAERLAWELGGVFRSRAGRLKNWLQQGGLDAIYVVGRTQDAIFGPDGRLVWGEGLLKLRCSVGRSHPFIRAIAPPASEPLDRVLDATLGMGQDALHLSAILGVRVEGIEASPLLAAWTKSGLERLTQDARWGPAAARVTVHTGLAQALLTQRPEKSVSVVYLDPMFETPLDASPGFRGFRRWAHPGSLDLDLMRAAIRVASRRVVVKRSWRDHRTPPVFEGIHVHRSVRGKAVDYDVVELENSNS